MLHIRLLLSCHCFASSPPRLLASSHFLIFFCPTDSFHKRADNKCWRTFCSVPHFCHFLANILFKRSNLTKFLSSTFPHFSFILSSLNWATSSSSFPPHLHL
jgi:hypothetical protein